MGRSFGAIRLNEDLARTLGINVFRYKLLSFAIGNALASFAGGLYGYYTGYIDPGYLGINQSMEVLAMVLLGGQGTLIGPIVGSLRAHRPAARHRPPRGDPRHPLRRHPHLHHSRDAAGHRRHAERLEGEAWRLRCAASASASPASSRSPTSPSASVPGEIVGIIGPNGSGKTTLLSMMAGLLAPTSGRVLWKGREIQDLRPDIIAGLGVVKTFQNPQVFAELSVFDNARVASHLDPQARAGLRRWLEVVGVAGGVEQRLAARVGEVLALCNLGGRPDQLAGNLSYGEEKMLGIAMALMCEPELLLLDEPASGLGRDEVRNLESVLDECPSGRHHPLPRRSQDRLSSRPRPPGDRPQLRREDRRGSARAGAQRAGGDRGLPGSGPCSSLSASIATTPRSTSSTT
mgnify:CR=1 FL=1